MGAQQSSEEDACQPCLGIGAPFRKKNLDPLGSPMPDSPWSSRHKRRENLSRYGGLEKELSAAQSTFYESNNLQSADVHEGSVRDGRAARVEILFGTCQWSLVYLRIVCGVVYSNEELYFGVNSVSFCCSVNCGINKYRTRRQPCMQSIS